MDKAKQSWPTEGKIEIDLNEMVQLYKQILDSRGEAFAKRITAEAIASESTAVQNAAEAIAFSTAEAIGKIAQSSK